MGIYSRRLEFTAVVVTMLSTSLLCGCGRFMEPIAPEMVAPKSVESLEVTAKEEGMFFVWYTPEKDRRGKELKFIDGYSVERKEIVERGDETDPDVKFYELAFIPDTSIEVREELREKAREEGKIGRKIQAPGELKQFSFLDPTVEKGRTYLYQIIPQNQGGVEGLVKQTIKVKFDGLLTDVSLLDGDGLEEDPTTLLDDQNTGNTRQ